MKGGIPEFLHFSMDVSVSPVQGDPTASLGRARDSERGTQRGSAKAPGNFIYLGAFEIIETLLLNSCLPAWCCIF